MPHICPKITTACPEPYIRSRGGGAASCATRSSEPEAVRTLSPTAVSRHCAHRGRSTGPPVNRWIFHAVSMVRIGTVPACVAAGIGDEAPHGYVRSTAPKSAMATVVVRVKLPCRERWWLRPPPNCPCICCICIVGPTGKVLMDAISQP
jgi:hypothetical protein